MTESVSISERPRDVTVTWVPVEACTLPTVEQPVRVAEFDALFAETLRHVDQDGAMRARLVLTGAADLFRRAQVLTDRETGCCSFFTFTITPTGPDSVAMEIAVPNERADILAALVQRAQAARTGALEAETA